MSAAGVAGVVVLLTVTVAAAAVGGGSAAAAGGGVGGGLAPGSVPAQYEAAIAAAGAQCPAATPAVIAAQLQAESGFRPDAVSPVGAQGIAQFMPATWATWGRDENGDGKADPFDPADAIPAQGRYDCALAAQLGPLLAPSNGAGSSLSGDLTSLMLAAYNAGPGAVIATGGIPQNGETPAYVARILAAAGTFARATGAMGAPGSGGDGSATGTAIVTAAARLLGTPYVWGGGGPTGPTGGGVDCSGLTLYAVYQATGGRVSLPHFTDYQLADPHAQRVPISKVGGLYDTAVLQPGDLIFFSDPTGNSAGGGVYHHVGIYAGNGQLLHAPKTGDVVKYESLTSSYWQAQTWAVARFA